MKTQAVSNQNFTAGRVIFVNEKQTKHITENLEEILAPQIKEELLEIRSLISKKPYDLFISRSKAVNGFYEVNANTSYENVRGYNVKDKGCTSFVSINRMEHFPQASKEAMRSFENADNYEKLTKKERNFFKILWNKITKKGAKN